MSTLDHAVAEFWLRRWDAQQERYIADREERFAVIGDVVRHRIRPGGAFVNGDHLTAGSRRLGELTRLVRDGRAARAGVTANEDWRTWWDAAQRDPRLAELIGARSRRAVAHGGDNEVTAPEHADLLRRAGFREVVGTVWQSGDDTVLVALR